MYIIYISMFVFHTVNIYYFLGKHQFHLLRAKISLLFCTFTQRNLPHPPPFSSYIYIYIYIYMCVCI